MTPSSWVERAGRLLFRLRSFTPVPVIVLGVVLTWRSQSSPGLGGPEVDAALDVLGIAVGLAGWAVRFLTVGLTPDSRTQTRSLETPRLHTGGMYAVVRHPLYLGNTLMTAGLLLVVDQLPAYLLGGGFFLAAYSLIIAAEERHLGRAFGEAWTRWAATVPLLVPRGLPRLQRLDWATALGREVTPLVAWGLGTLAVLGWQWWAKGQLTARPAGVLEVTGGLLLTALVANKLWKRARRSRALAYDAEEESR